MTDNLAHKAAQGAVWATIDRFVSMAMQFVVNMVLAHLLLPKDYGAIAVLTIFIAVSQTLIDGGFSSALIQKKEPTQTDYSTVFYWNVAFSLVLYLVLFAVAPLIAQFYRSAELCGVMRAIGLSLVIYAVVAIQQVRLRKSLAFRSLAITNIGAIALGSAVGIYLALRGSGVWSLVAMQLSQGAFSIVILQMLTRWHPGLVFSGKTMRELFSFGGFILAANVLQTACQNVQGLIIGRRFNQTQMGYFNQAYKLDQVTSYSIPQVIVQVMYPVYSSIQNEHTRLREMVLMNIRVISLIVFPILTCLIVVAEPLISALYGPIWLPSAPYFRVLCVGGLFVCLQNVNFYAVAAVGRSRALFNWSLYKWGFLLAALLVGMNFGMFGLLWAMVLSSVNIFVVNAFLAQKHADIPVIAELRIIAPILAIALAAMAPALWLNLGCGLHPAACAVVEIVLYILLALWLQPLAIKQLRQLLFRLINKNSKTI